MTHPRLSVSRNPALAMVVLLPAILTGCGSAEPEAPEAAPAPEGVAEPSKRPAATIPLPGQSGPSGEPLPEGHPPIAGGSEIPPPESPAQGAALHWDAPAAWVPVKPGSTMRLAQYRVPGPGGDAECIVYYFGPGQGGSPHDNAVRWAGQFKQPDGRSSLEVMELGELDGGSLPVVTVEVTGTYDGGMTMTDTPAAEQPDSMLLGGIAQGPDAPWFFKLTGPEATVRAQRDDFFTMLRTLHPAH